MAAILGNCLTKRAQASRAWLTLATQTNLAGAHNLRSDARQAVLQEYENSKVEEDNIHRRLQEMKEANSFAFRKEAQDGAGPRVDSSPRINRDGVEEGQETGALDWRGLLRKLREVRSLQPPTGEAILTDTFRRRHTYLRISLTERCNLRCLYCMPEEGVDLTPREELLTTHEIMRLASLFASCGVNKIRVTGGEPTVRKDIIELTAGLSSLPGVEIVGMTTNGLAVARKLEKLKAAGLNAINVSLDTLKPDRFEFFTRRKGHDRVMGTIRKALELGYDPVKVNVVVMKGQNDDEIPDFVELTRNEALNVRFIEYMPFDGNRWSSNKMVSFREMIGIISQRFPNELQRCQDPKGEVAKNFQLDGFKGSVSFVSSMTDAFCHDCNRLRLLADGNLKVCLFGINEVSLRDAMREGATDDELKFIISAAVDRKKAAHAGMFDLQKMQNRAMIKIGG